MTLLSIAPVSAYAQSSVDVDRLAEKFICTCGCNMLLSVCESQMACDVADGMKGELQAMLSREMSDDEIVREMQGRYGSQVLAVPPQTGFTLTLWVYPVIGVAIGSVFIYAYSRRRRDVKWHADPDEAPGLDEEELARLLEIDQAEKETQRKTSSRYDELLKEYRRRGRKGK